MTSFLNEPWFFAFFTSKGSPTLKLSSPRLVAVPRFSPAAEEDNGAVDIHDGSVVVGWDFSYLLPFTTIKSVVATACTVSAASLVPDPDAAACLQATGKVTASLPTPYGTARTLIAVSQAFTPHVAGCVYVLRCTVLTADGQTVTAWMRQPVVEAA